MRSTSFVAVFALLSPVAACLAPSARMPAAEFGATDSLNNLIANARFEDGEKAPWTAVFTPPASGEGGVSDGAFCLDVEHTGTLRWHVQVRHRELVIQHGHHYRVSFRAWSDKPVRIRPRLGMSAPPYREYWATNIALHLTPRTHAAEFTMTQPDDAAAEFAIHAGGADAGAVAPFRICLDDVVLEDPKWKRAITEVARDLPKLRGNQLGYLPKATKRATLVSNAAEPQHWELLDASGGRIAVGETRVHGLDAASGEMLHVIDFSTFKTPGTGYRLRTTDQQSRAFDIRGDLYDRLRYDALAFFYHQRSGIELLPEFAGHARWARPAGHLGDQRVRCPELTACNDPVDLAGGWYDAGDHGKYVVNAGIAVWTLLNQYERAVQTDRPAAVSDGRLRLPEAGNGVPDLLDEARWELEFLLKMQVPQGKPLAGLVHHKLHDEAWTALGVAPHEDKQPRSLKPPSTAATLNLAAVAAQAARVYASFDPDFSARCLEAAQRAFDAAQAQPVRYVPASDAIGGAAYADGDVRDEFYWAAAELLITTGDAKYRERLHPWAAQPIVTTTLVSGAGDPGQNGVFNWQNVAAAGAISLALAPPAFADDRAWARREIVRAADTLLAIRAREGYSLPFAAGPGPSYPWGSNSFVLNNAIALGLAYDFTHDAKYRDGVAAAMDYLLGNNALDQSYITGYGARPLLHPHHRFFSRQLRWDRPAAPPGIVSSGPSSTLHDPIAQALAGRAPQRCFVDHIESYSTNDVSISWNASLAWVTAFLADTAREP